MMMILARNWWALALRGLVAVLFGITAFAWPGITLGALVLLYGAYALVDGVFAVAAAISGRPKGMPWWALLIEGLAGIAVGIMTFAWPGITAPGAALPDRGLGRRHGHLRDRGGRPSPQGGPRRVDAGLERRPVDPVRPGPGRQSRRRGLAVVWLIGAYAVAFGVLLIALAFRLRGLAKLASTVGSSPSMETAAAHGATGARI